MTKEGPDTHDRASLEAVDRPSEVRVRRKVLRITQAELAQLVGVSRQTIIAVEQGDYAPSVFLALKIGSALGATVEELFGGVDPGSKPPRQGEQ